MAETSSGSLPLLRQFGQDAPNIDDRLDGPYGVAVTAREELAVVEQFNNRVQVFKKSGSPDFKFGSKGSASGQFDFPYDITISNNTFIVTDQNNKRVQHFELSGKFLGLFGKSFHRPLGISTIPDVDRVVVTDGDTCLVTIHSPDGNCIFKFGSCGEEDGQFKMPVQVTANRGRIIVSDIYLDRVQIFDYWGNFLRKFGCFGNKNGEFYNPRGLCTTANGDIIVADDKNDRVQLFDSDGRFKQVLLTEADGIEKPYGLNLTHNGELIVLNYGDNDIKVYDYTKCK